MGDQRVQGRERLVAARSMSRRPGWQRAVAWLAVYSQLFVFAMGCGESTLSHTGYAGPSGSGNVEVDPDRTPEDAPPANGCCIMVPAGGRAELEVDQFGQLPVGVLLFERQSGAPVLNEIIDFELTEDGGGEVSITERQSVTNEDGLAQVRFLAGEVLGRYTLKATHPGANSVEFTFQVEDLPSGELSVTYVNAGASVYDIAPIQVMVFPRSEFTCNVFRPLGRMPEPTMVDEVAGPNGRSEFTALDVREPWTVVAIGQGEFGQLAAAGCVGDVYIQEDETTNVEVVLSLLPLNPVGRYRVTSNWDFTQTLEDSGNVGQILLEVFDAFENPGRYLVDQIISLIRNFLGGIIAGAVEFFLDIFNLDDRIEDGINDFIDDIEFLRRVRQAGLDLRDIVTRLEVLSVMTIGKLGNDFEVRGTDDWLGLAFYWRWNCDENDPPDCGRIELAIDPDSSLGIVLGEWEGRVAAYNQLQINTHTVNLRYGQLILYILNEVILPVLTDGNANSMMDAILYWINCEGLARSITGSDGEICDPLDLVCVRDDQISGVCESVIRTVFGFAEILLENLQIDSVIELSGEGVIVERDGDLLVDEILDGTYDGWVNIQDSRSPFTATWSAEKLTAEMEEEMRDQMEMMDTP